MTVLLLQAVLVMMMDHYPKLKFKFKVQSLKYRNPSLDKQQTFKNLVNPKKQSHLTIIGQRMKIRLGNNH
jgi:hypothetical protein